MDKTLHRSNATIVSFASSVLMRLLPTIVANLLSLPIPHHVMGVSRPNPHANAVSPPNQPNPNYHPIFLTTLNSTPLNQLFLREILLVQFPMFQVYLHQSQLFLQLLNVNLNIACNFIRTWRRDCPVVDRSTPCSVHCLR